MDYKEKYKMAFERLKSKMKDFKEIIISREDVEEIFPELKESENDKIREDLIQWFNEFPDTIWRCHYKKDVIAWLEKQGEKKPVIEMKSPEESLGISSEEYNKIVDACLYGDKVEPKFKVGNWYQCTKDFFGKGVTFDKNTAYYCTQEGCLQNEYGCHIAIVKDLYDNFKLWTIEDAKDGDVLQLGNVTVIFQKCIGDGNCKCYCSVYDEEFEIPSQDGADNSYGCHDAIPATKEQHDNLFTKMKEAGYEWDAEKKELNEIKNELEIPFGAYDSELQEVTYYIPKGFHAEMDDEKIVIKKGEKSIAWSEDDECFLEDCIDMLYSSDEYGITHKAKIENWLDSLKDRILKQK